jgi:two-component system response regulator HydG
VKDSQLISSQATPPLNKGNILVIDDEKEMRGLLEEVFNREGYTVSAFPLAIKALEALSPGGPLAANTEKGQQVDAIVSDIKMAQLDGMQFLTSLQRIRPEIPVILITAFGSIDSAIEAMQRGAFHYVVKPFKLTEVKVIVQKAVEQSRLRRENTALRNEIKGQWGLGRIIGKSAAMKTVFDLIHRVASSTANVLITGESGTGKELVAKAIHENGSRAQGPFVAINCTAIPEDLLESELFGHSKGAFTGAVARKKGLFEEANGGTLFLDEIGDMSPSLQAKLLRAVQERVVRPVGDNQSIPIDVRIVTATHKDLKKAIQDGVFREDLYYRLSVIPISLPALRDRPDDIVLLAEHFLRKYVALNQSPVKGFTPEAREQLLCYRWPGNVRELENAIERAVVLAPGEAIGAELLPGADAIPSADQVHRSLTRDWPTLAQIEERYIASVLEKTGGRKDKAAQILGINRRTLYRKEREYGWVPNDIDNPDETPDHSLSEDDEN